MGITSEKYGVPHVRLSKEFGDLTDPEVQAQVDYQIEACPRAPNLWGAQSHAQQVLSGKD